MLSLQLLIDWINGELGCPADQINQTKIIRVIIAGNLVKSLNTSTLDTEDYKSSLDNIKLMDQLLLNLVVS